MATKDKDKDKKSKDKKSKNKRGSRNSGRRYQNDVASVLNANGVDPKEGGR